MADEYFYGVTLSKAGASVTWEPMKNDEEMITRTNKLVIKQILLGHDAKENEFNVIQAETMTLHDDTVKIPIAVLKAGETRSSHPDLEFTDSPVTFTLIKGTGPVHIHGQHLMAVEDFEIEENLEEEEEEDEDDDEDEGNPKKKVKLSNNDKGGKAAVSAKNNKKK